MKKVCWIIAGACSAIAMAFADQVAKEKNQLILLARNIEKLTLLKQNLELRYDVPVDILFFDAEKIDSHTDVAEKCSALAQHPIHLFIAFGVMGKTAAITHTLFETVKIINTNFTAAAALCMAFLPYFQIQKKGGIMVLGSVAGDRGRTFNFDYGAAKAALVPFCEGLRLSLAPFDVSVTLMKLGYIDTPMMKGKAGAFLAANPISCAQACLKAFRRKKAVCYFPRFWYGIMLVVKMMPRFLLRQLSL